jgi:hypothetical protein
MARQRGRTDDNAGQRSLTLLLSQIVIARQNANRLDRLAQTYFYMEKPKSSAN